MSRSLRVPPALARMSPRVRIGVGAAALVVVLVAGWLVWRAVGGGLVTMERSGGVAGGTVRVEVGDDGGLRIETRKHGTVRATLAADELAALRAELRSADFDHLPAHRMQPGADLQTYVVHYGGHKVTTNDVADLPGLAPLVKRLEGWIHRYDA
ncbi:hypothetical protein [Dactylosporangium sp. CA-092794]|uniref:hypothetical protein n=1 Tax=Dactylosporangium sp. CA-092794 TaxID=3239929 RepID=UPI003D945BB0